MEGLAGNYLEMLTNLLFFDTTIQPSTKLDCNELGMHILFTYMNTMEKS